VLFDWRRKTSQAPVLNEQELATLARASFYLQRLIRTMVDHITLWRASGATTLSATCMLQGLLIATMRNHVTNAYITIDNLFIMQDMSTLAQENSRLLERDFESFAQFVVGVNDPNYDIQQIRSELDGHTGGIRWKIMMEPIRKRVLSQGSELTLSCKCQLVFLSYHVVPNMMTSAGESFNEEALHQYFDQLRIDILEQALEQEHDIDKMMLQQGDYLLKLYNPTWTGTTSQSRRYNFEVSCLMNTILSKKLTNQNDMLVECLTQLTTDENLIPLIKKAITVMSTLIGVISWWDVANIGDTVMYHGKQGRICSVNETTCCVMVEGHLIEHIDMEHIQMIIPHFTPKAIDDPRVVHELCRVMATLVVDKQVDDMTRLNVQVVRGFISRVIFRCDPKLLKVYTPVLLPLALRKFPNEQNLKQMRSQAWSLMKLMSIIPPRAHKKLNIPHEWLPDYMTVSQKQQESFYSISNDIITVTQDTPPYMMLRSNRHVSCAQVTQFQYTIQVVQSAPHTVLCFGVAPYTNDMRGLPGWHDGSIGYHSHSDKVLQSHPFQMTRVQIPEQFKTIPQRGDFYKCSISDQYHVTFSKNGVVIATMPLPAKKSKYYAVMYVAGQSTSVKVRFGVQPTTNKRFVKPVQEAPLLEQIACAMNTGYQGEIARIPTDQQATLGVIQKGDIVYVSSNAKNIFNDKPNTVADRLVIIQENRIRYDNFVVKCVDKIFDSTIDSVILGKNIEYKLHNTHLMVDQLLEMNEFFATNAIRNALRGLGVLNSLCVGGPKHDILSILCKEDTKSEPIEEDCVPILVDVFNDYMIQLCNRVKIFSTHNGTIKPETSTQIHIPGANGLVIDFDQKSQLGNEDYHTSIEIKSDKLIQKYGRMDEIEKYRLVIPHVDQIQFRVSVPPQATCVLSFVVSAIEKNDAVVPVWIMKTIIDSGLYHEKMYQMVESSIKYLLLPTSCPNPNDAVLCQYAIQLLDNPLIAESVKQNEQLLQLLEERTRTLLQIVTLYEDRLCLMIDICIKLGLLLEMVVYTDVIDEADPQQVEKIIKELEEISYHETCTSGVVALMQEQGFNSDSDSDAEELETTTDELKQMIHMLHEPKILRNMFGFQDRSSLPYYLSNHRHLIVKNIKDMLLHEDMAYIQQETSVGNKKDLLKARHLLPPVFGDASNIDIAALSLMKQVSSYFRTVPAARYRVNMLDNDNLVTLRACIHEKEGKTKWEHVQLLDALFDETDGENLCGLFVQQGETFVPNPHFTSQAQLRYFEFFGRLLAVALLTKYRRTCKWDSSIWRAIVEDPSQVRTPQLTAICTGLNQVLTTPIAQLLRLFEWQELSSLVST
jgi:hypothetical protein